jgi:hypothetical protein
MRAILMASAAIFIVTSALPAAAADLAVVRDQRQYAAAVAVDCPPTPGGVLNGRLDRWRRKAGECVLTDWQDRPGVDVVWNNWNLW